MSAQKKMGAQKGRADSGASGQLSLEPRGREGSLASGRTKAGPSGRPHPQPRCRLGPVIPQWARAEWPSSGLGADLCRGAAAQLSRARRFGHSPSASWSHRGSEQASNTMTGGCGQHPQNAGAQPGFGSGESNILQNLSSFLPKHAPARERGAPFSQALALQGPRGPLESYSQDHLQARPDGLRRFGVYAFWGGRSPPSPSTHAAPAASGRGHRAFPDLPQKPPSPGPFPKRVGSYALHTPGCGLPASGIRSRTQRRQAGVPRILSQGRERSLWSSGCRECESHTAPDLNAPGLWLDPKFAPLLRARGSVRGSSRSDGGGEGNQEGPGMLSVGVQGRRWRTPGSE